MENTGTEVKSKAKNQGYRERHQADIPREHPTTKAPGGDKEAEPASSPSSRPTDSYTVVYYIH